MMYSSLPYEPGGGEVSSSALPTSTLLRLGRVSSQSPQGPLGGHTCVHTASSNWQQYIIKLISSFLMRVILRREMAENLGT